MQAGPGGRVVQQGHYSCTFADAKAKLISAAPVGNPHLPLQPSPRPRVFDTPAPGMRKTADCPPTLSTDSILFCSPVGLSKGRIVYYENRFEAAADAQNQDSTWMSDDDWHAIAQR